MKLFDKLNKKNYPRYLYTNRDIEEYDKYIVENFGEYDEVFHEIMSPDIHLDVIIVPPTEENNYYKLITMGMGAYKMKVPKELKKYELERAELIIYLPPTWNIKSEKEEDYWPIRCLKDLARLPIECNTWLGIGHTISSNENNDFYADNTQYCSMLLLNALNKDYKELDLKLTDAGKINFYQLYPLYKEELEYKINNNAKALLNIIEEDIMPVLNLNRKNYGKK